MKPRIVVSGVNLVDFGPLTVLGEALKTLVEVCADHYEIVALVHKASLIEVPDVTYEEFPAIKNSWLRRLKFEYIDSRKISLRLKPVLWIAMHDITPRVVCERQVVYCHNPAPFYRFDIREAILDPKFGMFVLFYRFLYGLFLQRNEAVIVQQQWIRREFERIYHAKHVIVATPAVAAAAMPPPSCGGSANTPYRFFYPAFARTFKNHELLLEAAAMLERSGSRPFELLLTIDASTNRFSAGLFHKYRGLTSVHWLGSISRDRVNELYAESNCLLFPSKLETWGLPISEFQHTGKPILAVNLPYAYETVSTYDKVAFFDAHDATALAKLMEKVLNGVQVWQAVESQSATEPYAPNWQALWRMLISHTPDTKSATSAIGNPNCILEERQAKDEIQ